MRCENMKNRQFFKKTIREKQRKNKVTQGNRKIEKLDRDD